MHFGQLQFSRMISFSFITLLPLSVLVLKLDHNSRDIFGYYVFSVQLIFFFIQKFDPYFVQFVKPMKENFMLSYLCMKYVDPFSKMKHTFRFPYQYRQHYSRMITHSAVAHPYMRITAFLFIWRLVYSFVWISQFILYWQHNCFHFHSSLFATSLFFPVKFEFKKK